MLASTDEPGAAQRLSRPLPPAASAEPAVTAQLQERMDREILRHKRRQVSSLRRMASASVEQPERLFRLARLELEVAILAEALGEQASLGASAVTCRRILAQRPAFREADAVRLFLAQLELRRGNTAIAREVLADLERLHPRSEHLCQAWLLGGETRQKEERFHLALEIYQRAAGSGGCPVSVVNQARYGAAWSLLGLKRYRAAVKTLRFLLSRSLTPHFRERVLKDLVVAWSMSEVDQDAVALIMREGSSGLGGRLLQQLARTLIKEGRLPQLLSLTRVFLARHPEHPLGVELREARLEGIARLSSATALQGELSKIARVPSRLRSPRLRSAMARALLVLARRLDGDPAASTALDRGQAPALYRQLIHSFPSAPQAHQARVRLAELQLDERNFSGAVALLQAARSSGPLDPRAQYQLVYGLAGMLEGGAQPGRVATLARFGEEVWRLAALQPRAPETAEALLLLSSQLLKDDKGAGAARAALTLIKTFPEDRRRERAAMLAIRALDLTARAEEAFNLATTELRRKPDNPGWLQRAAAVAAMKQCQALAQERRFRAARQWAGRAAQVDPDRSGRYKAALIGAAMSARAGDAGRARREYQELSIGTTPREFRLKALVSLAELSESQADFAAAAKAYQQAVTLAGSPAKAMEWLHLAGLAHAAAGSRELAIKRARELIRRLAKVELRGSSVVRWQLRAGELLESVSASGPAARHYINRAMEWRKRDPRASARFLLQAATLPVPRHKVISYITQAVQLAGPLSRKGRTSELAARARLAQGRVTRARVEAAKRRGGVRTGARARRRILELREFIAALLPVIKTGHQRYAVEAGLQVTWAYGALADTMAQAQVPLELSREARVKYAELVKARAGELRQAGGRLIARLAPLVRRAAHRAEVLDELRQHLAPGLAAARIDVLPDPTSDLEPLRGHLLQGRHQVAARGLSSALRVHGPREDLLCLRGVARLRAGELTLARRDFAAAARRSSESRCARLNLAGLAVRRGDFEAAEGAIGELEGHEALILRAALAYGRRDFKRAAALARRAIKENKRSPATFLLGLVLVEHLKQPREGQALLRRCVEDELDVRDLARDRLRRLGVDITGA